MDSATRLLENSGFRVLSADGGQMLLEDPSCIVRAFETFAEYAWIAITAMTFLFLFGWGIAMIRGTKPEVWTNLKNLAMIFGVLSAAPLAVNLIYGGDIFSNACKIISVDRAEVQKLLDARKLAMKSRGGDLYEDFDIWDTGATEIASDSAEMPYSESPVYGAGSPQKINSISTGGKSRTTQFIGSDGRKHTKTDGTAAWRNNNPGNIEYGDFAKRNGAIGTDGRFAIFPDEATGRRAIASLLQTNKYRNLSMADAVKRYAPPHENDTEAYRAALSRNTGIALDKKMGQLSDAEMERVVKEIQRIEGWKQGKETIG